MMAHPMHLHGMFMQLENGQQAENLPNKHTIIVPPGKTVTALLTADALGEWAIHCHLLYHMSAGMMNKLIVAQVNDGQQPLSPSQLFNLKMRKELVMRITKLFSQMICCGAFSGISVFAFAQEPLTHDHLREHGGQVYQATKIDTGWTQNEEGEGSFSSELESWVGTDENKLFIKAHVDKAESEEANYGGSLLYSRNVADYWDVQAG